MKKRLLILIFSLFVGTTFGMKKWFQTLFGGSQSTSVPAQPQKAKENIEREVETETTLKLVQKATNAISIYMTTKKDPQWLFIDAEKFMQNHSEEMAFLSHLKDKFHVNCFSNNSGFVLTNILNPLKGKIIDFTIWGWFKTHWRSAAVLQSGVIEEKYTDQVTTFKSMLKDYNLQEKDLSSRIIYLNS